MTNHSQSPLVLRENLVFLDHEPGSSGTLFSTTFCKAMKSSLYTGKAGLRSCRGKNRFLMTAVDQLDPALPQIVFHTLERCCISQYIF